MNRTPRHPAMVDFHQHQERLYVVLEEDHEKVEKENVQLRAELARVTDQRDAILQQARAWSCEAKFQRSTVQEVGAILGGIPDWGPIAAGVQALSKQAARYRWLRDHYHGFEHYRTAKLCVTSLDDEIDGVLERLEAHGVKS